MGFQQGTGAQFFFNLFNWPHFFRSHDFGEPLYERMRHQIPIVYEMRSSQTMFVKYIFCKVQYPLPKMLQVSDALRISDISVPIIIIEVANPLQQLECIFCWLYWEDSAACRLLE